jgi:hypothetical protein
LPKDLPPKSTAHSYFMLWEWDGTLERIHHELYVAMREQDHRVAPPGRSAAGSAQWHEARRQLSLAPSKIHDQMFRRRQLGNGL